MTFRGGTAAAFGRDIRRLRWIGVGRIGPGGSGSGGDGDDDDENERNAEFGRMALRLHAQNRKVEIGSDVEIAQIFGREACHCARPSR